MAEPTFWRVRMKVGGWRDCSEEAWQENKAGFWYGTWTADDWRQACQNNPDDPWPELKALPHQQALNWEAIRFTPNIRTAIRFEREIRPDDWIVVYLRSDENRIGLAQLEPELYSDAQSPLNEELEVFKYRRIARKKSFKLSLLPDVYRLLPSQGRATVYQLNAMRSLVTLLVNAENEDDVWTQLRRMSFADFLDALGASSWEAVCTAYLVLEHNFVPLGLATGKTLAVFDIIGRDFRSEVPILAQCKKMLYPVGIDDKFTEAISAYETPPKAFYFAFGGCVEPVPANIEVIDQKAILGWFESTENGRRYRKLLNKL